MLHMHKLPCASREQVISNTRKQNYDITLKARKLQILSYVKEVYVFDTLSAFEHFKAPQFKQFSLFTNYKNK